MKRGMIKCISILEYFIYKGYIMNRELNYDITKEDKGKTILHFLKEKGFSHPIITGLKKTPQGIQVNGRWEYVSYMLKEDERLSVHIVEQEDSPNIVPVRLPLDILYEDEDILLLNKPSDMPIHPSLNNYENTLANALASYYKKESSPFVFRCMNRLDRDTTGITLIAKNPLSAAILSRDMKARKIHRTYYAIVEGTPPQLGCINAPIARVSDSLITREVNYEDGQPAITHYETLTSQNGYSLVRLQLETGRTHQIRVHMKHIGHPLPGDYLYNPDSTIIKRQALHAGELEFVHPITKKSLHIKCDLPNDMKQLIYGVIP